MSKSAYASALSKNVTTPQSQPIPGREKEQVKNNAGGFVFTVTPFQMLERFLILGSDKPTYYASAQKLTKNNAKNIQECLKLDGKKTVDTIVSISVQGRAPKNDGALFALAVACTPECGSQETAQYALTQLSKVARTGTHLFHFTEYLNSMRGWGRSVKNAVGAWYTEKNEGQLAYQLAKYQNRDGWGTKDVLALAHVKTSDERKAALLAWASQGGLDRLQTASESWNRIQKSKKSNFVLTREDIFARRKRFARAHAILTSESGNALIAAYEAAKTATTAKEIVSLIQKGGLSHEMIPTQFKTEPEVWEALLEKMPVTAMVRNLGNMTKIGLLKPLSNASKEVVRRLSDEALVKKSKIHPLQLMLAGGTYGQGKGNLGSSVWTPVGPIVDALEEAFYLAFANVIPTGKNIAIGMDISGSMGYSFIGSTGISCAQAAAAMALVVARTEKNYALWGFSTNVIDLGITAKDTLKTAMQKTANKNFGGTDCAALYVYAKKVGLEADAFLTITDNETWHGGVHPTQALKQYRTSRGKNDIRQIVMSMTATEFTIADPTDPFSLDVVGFDSNVPLLITDFIRGAGAGLTDEDAE